MEVGVKFWSGGANRVFIASKMFQFLWNILYFVNHFFEIENAPFSYVNQKKFSGGPPPPTPPAQNGQLRA